MMMRDENCAACALRNQTEGCAISAYFQPHDAAEQIPS